MSGECIIGSTQFLGFDDHGFDAVGSQDSHDPKYVITVVDAHPHITGDSYRTWEEACKDAERSYFALLEEGVRPQLARDVLPNSLKTEIVMTTNPREWRHVFKLRCAEAAHPQMREVMIPCRNEFAARWPALFADLMESAR